MPENHRKVPGGLEVETTVTYTLEEMYAEKDRLENELELFNENVQRNREFLEEQIETMDERIEAAEE